MTLVHKDTNYKELKNGDIVKTTIKGIECYGKVELTRNAFYIRFIKPENTQRIPLKAHYNANLLECTEEFKKEYPEWFI
ncbi:hypothetical protein [Seleniivibrio woodruffii]|uniref:hypothetical protein n=1 Tax=Seleniivibrio woodruffii TaxID=1078050 RepID=UPI0024095A68|nr:hypothetical protein [Seleniivibrio woodruffii]